jgi:hypothetical protein
MSRWSIHQPEPRNVGEPQSVRDAYDRILQGVREANAQIEEAMSEIEID